MVDNFPERSATGSHIPHGLESGLFHRIGNERFPVLGQMEAVRNPSENSLPLPPFVVGGHRSTFGDYVPFEFRKDGQEAKYHPANGARGVDTFREGRQVGAGLLEAVGDGNGIAGRPCQAGKGVDHEDAPGFANVV